MDKSICMPDCDSLIVLREGEEAEFRLKGELDHAGVRPLREAIDSTLILYRPLHVTLDLSEVTFADSAGLGLILGRYARIKEYGGELQLTGVSKEFQKILHLAGADRMMRVNGGKTEK